MLTIVLNNIPCKVCGSLPHIYQDKEEQLVCLNCRKQGRDTIIKLTDGVVIGRYIQN